MRTQVPDEPPNFETLGAIIRELVACFRRFRDSKPSQASFENFDFNRLSSTSIDVKIKVGALFF